MKGKYIIVDIDGTIAGRDEKSPYDGTSIETRAPIPTVIKLVLDLYAHGYGILFVSGRKYNTRLKTTSWIKEHMSLDEHSDYQLFMRGDDDNRSDDQIKLQIWEEMIRGRYQVEFVLDDRNQVVKMWRSQGLTCLQVAEGDF